MNYTESNQFHDEAWLYQDFESFTRGDPQEERREEPGEAEAPSPLQTDLVHGLDLQGTLEFDGNLQFFQGKLLFIPVLYLKLAEEPSQKQLAFYKMNSHSSLLPFLGIQKEKSGNYLLFEHQSLKALPSFLQKAVFAQKLSLAVEMIQIFSYFAAKDATFAPNLVDFCLTRDDRLVFFNPTGREEFFTAAPETLAFGVASRKTSSWALGMILFELLTGRHPFSGEAFSALRSDFKDLPEDQVFLKKEEYFFMTLQRSVKFNVLEELLDGDKREVEKWMRLLKDLLRPAAKSRVSIEEFLESLN